MPEYRYVIYHYYLYKGQQCFISDEVLLLRIIVVVDKKVERAAVGTGGAGLRFIEEFADKLEGDWKEC